MFAEHDKHYTSRSGKTSLATAVTNITIPVTKNNFGPSTRGRGVEKDENLRTYLMDSHGHGKTLNNY